MIRSLVLLLDLLTNYQAVESLARGVFSLGVANTVFAGLLGSVELIRRMKFRRTATARSRVWSFQGFRRHSV